MKVHRLKTAVVFVLTVYLLSVGIAYYLLHVPHKTPDILPRIRIDQMNRHKKTHTRPESLRIGHPLFKSCLRDSNYENLLLQPYHTLGNIYIYSAFFDNRTGIPHVRMMTMINRQQREQELNLWCHFGYGNQAAVQQATFYEMCENHHFSHGGWIISCQIPIKLIKQIPCEFFIKQTKFVRDSHPTVMIPLLQTSTDQREDIKGQSSGKIGICVPPLYGDIKPAQVIKFMALTNTLGIEHIIFYVYNITRELNSVLEYLEDRGTITIINWELPVANNHIWYYGQSIAINDCLYRSMFYFKYLAFTDIDEYIVPRIYELSLLDLIEQKSLNNNSIAAFRFASAFFIRNPEAKGNESFFDVTEHIYRTQGVSKIRSKIIVEPYKIYEVGIHHVSRTWPDSKEYITWEVDPGEAIVHHYRHCTPTLDLSCSSFITDATVPDWHLYNFNTRFKSRMKEIGLYLNLTINT